MSCRKKFALAVVIIGAAVLLIAVIHHYQLRAAVDAYRAELKAKGELLDVAQLLPPPVPPEENSADIIRKFAVLLAADKSLLTTNYDSPPAMKMIAPGKAMACWQQPDVPSFDKTNSWQSFADAVRQDAPAYELLHQIIDRPNFDFQINYDAGTEDIVFTNLYLIQVKYAALWLETAALSNLHRGDTDTAVKDLHAMLALVKAMSNERLIISELVRMALANVAVAVNWEILQSPNLSDEQLAELQNDWAELQFIQQHQNALAMEQACGEIMLNHWRSDSGMEKYFDSYRKTLAKMGMSDDKRSLLTRLRDRFDILQWRYWWSYSDELRSLRGYEVLMATAPQAGTNGLYLQADKDQQAKLDALGFTNLGDDFDFGFSHLDLHVFLSESIVGLGNTFNRVMRSDTADHIVLTAIALKRFELKHGDYPGKLSDLVPEFLASVPLDAVDGQPLRYRRNADGTFLLYSVGENGMDDGGDPSLPPQSSGATPYWQNPKARDWVWPQPATADEIQKYYADHAAKSK